MAVYEVPCDLPEHTGDGPASLARKPAGSDQNHRRRLSEIERDEEGFLLDVHDWYPELADEIAAEADQPLTQEHREIIAYIREHFERNDSVPEARTLLKHLAENWGPERATRRYLYALFPRGYGQVACKIAGMRKPRKLMLDV
ncbi:MAG: TusE/DsrC/DsvC family sulfur relay protein [Chromatiales bacterium]|nr:TusE/DsrC/DsvC family sulfur relay protein [Chromatiales bacterium]